ncbi:MAG: hypothetical protein AMS17_15705 [Spirochaetes bacterium DG_61]|nr:MAG: hypothetical protein AMS17_15705 [Spirochaetes bacterium DG_61]
MRTLKQRGVGINAIAMDMWPAYIKAVQKYYPKKVIVFDRYHIIQDCNRMLDELRRKEVAKESLKERKEVYTGTRYLLLKGKEKIDNLPEAREKLDRLLALNDVFEYSVYTEGRVADIVGLSNQRRC